MASPSLAPSASTRSMSSDRGAVGKIVGHLYLAAKILLEGHACSMDEVRHEIRAMMSGGGPEINPENYEESLVDAHSLLAWNKSIRRVLLASRKLPNSTNTVPDDFKRELAQSIKQGRRLCPGGGPASDEARMHIKKASQLYRQLSGCSYL